MLESYLLFLLSHLLGDFVFQTKEIRNKKADNQLKGCLIHFGIILEKNLLEIVKNIFI